MTSNALLTVTDVKNFIIDAMKRDRVMSRKELMAYFGWDQYKYSTNLQKGMPWFGKKSRKQFILSDVRKWINEENRV